MNWNIFTQFIRQNNRSFFKIFRYVNTCLFTYFTSHVFGNSYDEYMHLDKIALSTGTDKASNMHNYTQVYARYFAPLKNKPIKLLEIGIGGGHSVKLWEEYFPHGDLYFIDHISLPNHSQRSQYHVLDQASVNDLHAFILTVGGNFDIIIDDGGHRMNQQITSFNTLFKYLKSGGLYIIEDLHTSYWKNFGGKGDMSNPLAGEGTTVEFLKDRVEDLNYTSGATGYADWGKIPESLIENLNEFASSIFSIHFYKSLCIIEKR